MYMITLLVILCPHSLWSKRQNLSLTSLTCILHEKAKNQVREGKEWMDQGGKMKKNKVRVSSWRKE